MCRSGRGNAFAMMAVGAPAEGRQVERDVQAGCRRREAVLGLPQGACSSFVFSGSPGQGRCSFFAVASGPAVVGLCRPATPPPRPFVPF